MIGPPQLNKKRKYVVFIYIDEKINISIIKKNISCHIAARRFKIELP